MRKIRGWIDKYDWGTLKELGKLILLWAGIACWLYFLWLIAEAIMFK